MPHRDHGVTTVANFYFKSNDSTTTFYREIIDAEAMRYGGDLSVAHDNIYSLDSIEPVASFTARDGDCYLLNVSEIHGVYSEKPGMREFINMQWYNKSIDEIYNSIAV
jgi:hypothetical protein